MATARLMCTVLALMTSLRAAMPVTDESLRLEVLAAIFPGMTVSAGAVSVRETTPPEPRAFPPIDFPDALAGERVYYVTGEPVGPSERCAAEDMVKSIDRKTPALSQVRELRFKVFALPSTHDAIAVVQYGFTAANPAGSCWSVGRVIRLSLQKTGWQVIQDRVLEEQHHTRLEDIQMIDLDGDELDELVVDMNWGGAPSIVGSSLLTYSLQQGKLEERLRVTSRFGGEEGAFEQKLDVAATKASHGERFCFRRTEYAEAHYKLLSKPKISTPCYPKYEGVEHH